MIVTAGTANATGATGTPGAPQPSTGVTPPPVTGGAPSIFYWKANVLIRGPQAPPVPESGAVSGRYSIGSAAGYVVATGVALLGSFLVL
jgi:hypothetical protein